MAAAAAVLLSVAGCTWPGQQPGGQSGNDKNIALGSPTPSASPTPTQEFAVNGPAFHVGEVGVNYAPVAYTASGGVAPYQWTISGGSLPAGLNLGNDGTVSGTPTSSGKFPFTLHVADAGTSKADVSASITVAPALNASLIPACAKYCNVELGCTNACGNFGTQTGGVGPFSYKLTQGSVPSGTSLSGLSLKGTFTGKTGFLQFTVQITDSLGATDTASPTFWMYPHIALTGGTIPSNPQFPCWWTGYDPVSAPGCRATFPYSGGTPNSGTPSASAAWATYSNNCNTYPPPAKCNPPPLPSIAVSAGFITISVPPGTIYWGSGYTGTLTVTLTNKDVCSPGPTRCSTSAQVTITQQTS